ncbi:MAG TPA: hypothetical protein DCY27_10175, partial [Desulfobacterales bacterium]|nr:hypothetical protein [Desulfobacterales bacterium]
DARDGFCESLRECCEKYPDTYFIVKPHPNEDFNFYRRKLRAFRGGRRVKVVPDAYSLEVLKISGLSVQRICTTGLEAAILGRPAVDFDYGVQGAYEGDVLKGIWPEAGSKEELFHLFDQWRNGDNGPWAASAERRRAVVNEWASLNKGEATKKAAGVIADLCESANGYQLGLIERALHMARYCVISFLKDVYRKIFPDRWGRYNKAPNFCDFAVWRRKFSGLV